MTNCCLQSWGSALVVFHRQEQAVGQAGKGKSKGRNKYHPPQGGKGGRYPKTKRFWVLAGMGNKLPVV